MTDDERTERLAGVPPCCGLCGKTKRAQPGAVKVPGQGAVLLTYWICVGCDESSGPVPSHKS